MGVPPGNGPNLSMFCHFSVPNERAPWDDHRRDQRLADLGLLGVPVCLGQQMQREVRTRLPGEQVRLVRQVQVRIRMAAGRPWRAI